MWFLSSRKNTIISRRSTAAAHLRPPTKPWCGHNGLNEGLALRNFSNVYWAVVHQRHVLELLMDFFFFFTTLSLFLACCSLQCLSHEIGCMASVRVDWGHILPLWRSWTDIQLGVHLRAHRAQDLRGRAWRRVSLLIHILGCHRRPYRGKHDV